MDNWRNAASELHRALDMGAEIPALDCMVRALERAEAALVETRTEACRDVRQRYAQAWADGSGEPFEVVLFTTGFVHQAARDLAAALAEVERLGREFTSACDYNERVTQETVDHLRPTIEGWKVRAERSESREAALVEALDRAANSRFGDELVGDVLWRMAQVTIDPSPAARRLIALAKAGRRAVEFCRAWGPWDSGNPDHVAGGQLYDDLYNDLVRWARDDATPRDAYREDES